LKEVSYASAALCLIELLTLPFFAYADQTAWKHVASDLVKDHKVIVYDMMGAGGTNPEDFSFAHYSR
jgi:hypothetical protein